MAYRRIAGLEWARPLSSWPRQIPKPRAKKGAKAAGLRYEKQLGEALPDAKHGQWFEFRDKNGPGLCQMDYLLISAVEVVVLECKYSSTPEAYEQLERLYLPILRSLSKKHVIGLQVCKRIDQGAELVVPTLDLGLKFARQGRRVCWQWLGNEVVSCWVEELAA